MTIEAKTKALLDAIERRLTDISEQQHALAVEKARLLEQLTPLRLGVMAPDTAVVQLKGQGGYLPGPDNNEMCGPAPSASDSEGGGAHAPGHAPRPLTCSRTGPPRVTFTRDVLSQLTFSGLGVDMSEISWWTVSIDGRNGPKDMALCALARQTIRNGMLPRRGPDRAWCTNGDGAHCAICGQPITPDHVRYTIQFDHEGRGARVDRFQLHLRCFAAWEMERTKPTH
jgi:hypothetical protein